MYSIILIVMGVAEGNYSYSSVATTMIGKYESLATCEVIAKQMSSNFRGETNIMFLKRAQCVQIKDKP